MKIMLISHSPLISGGAEKSLLEYTEVLKEQGHECLVILPGKGEFSKRLTSLDIKWVTVGYSWATKPHRKSDTHRDIETAGRSISGIYKEVQKYKPDIIITNTTVVPWGLYVARELNIPSILLVHEILHDKQHVLNMEPSYEGYVDILDKTTDYIIYNSKTTKESYKDLIKTPTIAGDLLFPVPKIKDIIDTVYISCKPEEQMKFAVIGSVQAEKNQMEVLLAAREMIKNGTHKFTVNIYGDGNVEYVLKLKKFIKKNGLERNVKLKGYIDNIYEQINKNNVVISPFKKESFGRAVIEGQLFGRLVISNTTGASTDLIEDGQTGLLYESGNSKQLAERMTWAIEHQDESIKIGKNARKIQREKYLSSNQYKALIDAISYFDLDDKGVSSSINRYSPIASLSAYANGLEHRYRHIFRITHNRVTRTILHYIRAAVRKVYRFFKR